MVCSFHMSILYGQQEIYIMVSCFQVGLASGEGNYTDIVREAQKNINLPNVLLVDAMGLPLRDDQLHLSTEAQLQLGNMLAEAYLKFNSSRGSML